MAVSTRRRLAIAVAVVIVAAGGIAHAVSPSANRRGAACAGDCAGVLTVLAERPPPAADREAAATAKASLERAVAGHALEQCNRVRGDTCRRHLAEESADVTVEEVVQALRTAGLTGAEVRAAAPGDPAPAGRVVYAVPVAGSCVIGYQKTRQGAEFTFVAGRRPDGRCLRPGMGPTPHALRQSW
jgi:hypothetical protein